MKTNFPFGHSGGCRPETDVLNAPGLRSGALLTSLLVAAMTVALPGAVQAQAQGCGGSISIATDPNTTTPNQIPFTGAPLGETVRIMLTPAKGTGTVALTVDQVSYALACADNNDLVPCANGNDIAASGGAPIAFAGNVSGTCGATNANTTDNGDGTIRFNFPSKQLGEAGCTVEFDVTVNDKGTDASPLILTSAAATLGTCVNGLQGAARGSVAIFLTSVPEIDIVKEISLDDGTTWFDANTEGAAPVVPFPSGALYRFTVTNTGTAPLIDVTVEDADLGIAPTAIANLAPGDSVVIGSGSAGFEALAVDERCANAGVFANTAKATGTSGDDAVVVMDTDPAVLVCVGTPDIEILKEISIDGGTIWFDANDVGSAPQAEFPSDAAYRLTVTNTGTTDLVDVTVNDPTLGIVDFAVGSLLQGEVRILEQGAIAALFVQDRCTNSGEFFNTASASGNSGLPIATVNDSDIAILVCVGDPMIDLLKEISIDGGTTWFDANDVGTAPTAVWPSDASYRVTVTNIGTAPLVNITVSDMDLAIPATAIPNLDPTESYVITSGNAGFEALFAADRCTGSGTFFNTAQTSGQSAETGEVVTAGDPAILRCVGNPDIDLLKEISIDGGTTWFDANDAGSAPTAFAPSDAYYRLTVTNTGTADLENITVSDPTLGLVDVPVDNLAIGASVVLDSGSLGFAALFAQDRCTTAGEFPNNASTQGDSAETGETVSDSDPAVLLCEVQFAEICRTPGFWSTHAGTEKNKASNLTQLTIDAAGGSLSICGTTIDNTTVGSAFSALEAMCVSPKGDQRLQLARQLTAMALNCVVSGGGADCSGTSGESLFQAANEACANGVANAGDYIAPVDAFNNGVNSDCHERDLSESDVFDGVSPLPGPAGSPKACNAARTNNVIVLP
ncbi:MAG: hypothetical protein U1A22_04770 [Xanthomonadaceae bacterium]|nr:hypothetical protein [Xanthomonadaceae bacterium]